MRIRKSGLGRGSSVIVRTISATAWHGKTARPTPSGPTLLGRLIEQDPLPLRRAVRLPADHTATGHAPFADGERDLILQRFAGKAPDQCRSDARFLGPFGQLCGVVVRFGNGPDPG